MAIEAPSPRALSWDLAEKIRDLSLTTYATFNDTHFTEKLRGKQDSTQMRATLKDLAITPIFSLTQQAKGHASYWQHTYVTLKELSAIGAEGETPVHFPPTRRAPHLPYWLLSTHTVAAFIEDGIAMVTDQKGDALFHRKQRYKKQAHIVIYPLKRDVKMPA